MKKMTLRATTVFAMVIGLTQFGLISCGGPGVIEKASVRNVVSNFGTIIQQMPKGNAGVSVPSDVSGPAGGISASAIRPSAAASCYSDSPTTLTDADTDGIALTKTTTIDCSDFSFSGYTLSQKGFFKVTDLDDTIKGTKGGYKYEFNMPTWYWKSNATGLVTGGSHIGSWTTTGTDTSTRFLAKYDGRYYGEIDLTSQGQGKSAIDFTYVYSTDVNFTHDAVAATAVWSAGTMNGSGSYALNGTFFNESRTGTQEKVVGSGTVTWVATNLAFASTCTKFYKSGNFNLTDIGGNVVRIDFACTEMSVYLNGSKVDGAGW
jgi:hypothetical protein